MLRALLVLLGVAVVVVVVIVLALAAADDCKRTGTTLIPTGKTILIVPTCDQP